MTISATLAIFHSLCSRRHCRRRRGDSPQPSQALGRLHLGCSKYQGHSYWGHIGGVILSYTGSSGFQKVLSLSLSGPPAVVLPRQRSLSPPQVTLSLGAFLIPQARKFTGLNPPASECILLGGPYRLSSSSAQHTHRPVSRMALKMEM